MQRDDRPAKQAQIEYARDLILKLGYDLDWYDLDKMTRGQISRLIDELRTYFRQKLACFTNDDL